MPSGDMQPLVSAKKITLRDLPSETNIFTSSPLDYTPLKDSGSIPVTAKLSGTKREQPCSPYTHPHHQNISGGHLVYVRRKLDTEPNKICGEKEEQTDSPFSSDCRKDLPSESKLPGECEAKLSGVPALLLSPVSHISSLVSEPFPSTKNSGNLLAVSLTDLNSLSPTAQSENHEGYWKERFIRLQIFLKNCDKYNQEKYVHGLRSLSAADRSLHAVELEKRAIQLLLDEGRELQKMKVLNVLGKPLSDPELQKMKVLNVLGKPLSDPQTDLSYRAFLPEPLPFEK